MSPPSNPRANGEVLAKVEALLVGRELDAHGEAQAAIALALARKLDDAAVDKTGAVAMAIAGISKELRAVLDSLLQDATQDAEFIADLYAEVGDP